jgi:hypothetical protein
LLKLAAKTIVFLFILGPWPATVAVAQDFPGYGTVSAGEISLKECPFDKEANAVVLIHEAFSNYDEQHRLLTTHHVRIKILKDKGIPLANITIPFYRKDEFEKIDMVEAMTINAQATNDVAYTKVDNKSIFYKPRTSLFGEVLFALPAIKAGSIVDYKYRSTMKSYGGLDDWRFQEELPVMTSRYTLVIVPNTEFTYRVNKTLDIPVTVRKESFSGGVYFEMDSIPGLGDEPYMDAREDYLQKVIFQLSGFNRYGDFKSNYMTSWDEMIRELVASPEFGGQLNKNIPGTADFIRKAKALPSPGERMKAVYDYVRSNMNWNGIYSRYAMAGVREAWAKKNGSSSDINLLLVNLLKESSLEAYPLLVSERFHGKVSSTYPFIGQFNTVFAFVVIDNRKYFLNATDAAMPAHLTPVTILNTTALLVNRRSGGLISIVNDSLQFHESIIVDCQLAPNGAVSGDVSVSSSDYARIIKLHDYKQDRKKFLENHFVVYGSSIIGTDPEVSGIENDSLRLEQHCKLSGSLNNTGEYYLLPLNLFTGFDYNPFLSDNRFSNINFGYRRTVNLNVSIQLPPGYTVDELPRSVKLTDPDKDIIYIRQVDHDKSDNIIRCMMLFSFKKSLYEADRYPVVKAMYQRIFGYLKEPLLLKRK